MNRKIARGRVPADLRKELRLRDQETMEALTDTGAGLTVDGNIASVQTC